MSTPTIDRQQIIEAVRALPDEALAEVADLIDRLRQKSTVSQESPKEILARIAALQIEGKSDAFSGRDHDRIV